MSIKTFIKDEKGQSMVEYGITLGGVAAVSYIAIVMMGDRVADLFAWMANHLPGGEDDDGGQVRVNGEGLVGLSSAATFNDELEFGNRTADNFTMEASLGSGGVAGENATGAWD